MGSLGSIINVGLILPLAPKCPLTAVCDSSAQLTSNQGDMPETCYTVLTEKQILQVCPKKYILTTTVLQVV